MNGVQFLLLAFSLNLIEVINALLIGRVGRSGRSSGRLFVGIGFFRYDLIICNSYLFGYLCFGYVI